MQCRLLQEYPQARRARTGSTPPDRARDLHTLGDRVAQTDLAVRPGMFRAEGLDDEVELPAERHLEADTPEVHVLVVARPLAAEVHMHPRPLLEGPGRQAGERVNSRVALAAHALAAIFVLQAGRQPGLGLQRHPFDRRTDGADLRVGVGVAILRAPEAHLDLDIVDRTETSRALIAAHGIVAAPAELELGTAALERAGVIHRHRPLGEGRSGAEGEQRGQHDRAQPGLAMRHDDSSSGRGGQRRAAHTSGPKGMRGPGERARRRPRARIRAVDAAGAPAVRARTCRAAPRGRLT